MLHKNDINPLISLLAQKYIYQTIFLKIPHISLDREVYLLNLPLNPEYFFMLDGVSAD